jgi:hypothetical protein
MRCYNDMVGFVYTGRLILCVYLHGLWLVLTQIRYGPVHRATTQENSATIRLTW